MGAKQVVGDDHTEHRVAEELQPLVGFQPSAFVGIRAVGEGESQQLGVEINAERAE